MNKSILLSKQVYEGLGFPVIMGYCYLKRDHRKSFIPIGGKIPEWKVNSLQIIPGAIASIVDCDIRGEIDGSKNLPCAIPEGTPTDKSQSGAFRYWFKADQRLHSITGDNSRIDFLTGNTPVLVAPSRVQGGGSYTWISPLSLSELQPMPEVLFNFFLEKQRPEPAPISQTTTTGTKGLHQISPKQRECLFDALNRFQDSQTGFRVFVWSVAIGLDRETVWGMCKDFPYCKKRGRRWFDHSFENAIRKAS